MRHLSVTTCVGVCALSSSLTAQVRLLPTGFTAKGVSADGQVVYGLGMSSGVTQAAIWRESSGLQLLGVPSGCDWSEASGASGDGAVISVRGHITAGGGERGYIWREGQPWVEVTYPGSPRVVATCVSRDGTTVGGVAVLPPGFYQGMVWTEAGGARLVPGGTNYASWIHDLSPDGLQAVGSGSSSVGTWGMFWPSTYTWCIPMGVIAGQRFAKAVAMTPDGSLAVGQVTGAVEQHGLSMVWTQAGGIELLPAPSPYQEARLNAVSDDGRVAVGVLVRSGDWNWRDAVVWRRGHGFIMGSQYFAARGVSVGSSGELVDVSADGRVFVLETRIIRLPRCGSADFNRDGHTGTDADIEAFFRCLAGDCCPLCDSADFDGDGDTATDADIEAFFRVLGGGAC